MNTVWLTEAWVDHLLAALPLFARSLGMVLASPFLGQRGVPVQVRVGLALLLAALLAPVVSTPVGLNFLQRAAACAEELLIGLALGFVVRLVFASVHVTGQLVEVPMGLGMAELFDTSGGGRVPLFGQFYYFLVAQVFFAFDGHLAVFRALGDSLQLVPVGQAAWGPAVGEEMIRAMVGMFGAGVRMAVPVLIAVLVTDSGLAIANRAVPQLNIFSVGFPLKGAIGLLAVLASLPFLVEWAATALGPGGMLLQHLYGVVQGLAR